MALAVANYESTYGSLPPAYVLGPDGRPWHSWRVLILPFLEQSSIYERYRFDEPWDGPRNRELASLMPNIYKFSYYEKPGNVTTNYLAVVGAQTAWPGATPRKLTEIRDGTANTILVIENFGAGVHWMEPRDAEFDRMSFALDNPLGLSSWLSPPAIVTVEGYVRKTPRDMKPETLRALLTSDGGEPVDGAWEELKDGRDRPHGAPNADPPPIPKSDDAEASDPAP